VAAFLVPPPLALRDAHRRLRPLLHAAGAALHPRTDRRDAAAGRVRKHRLLHPRAVLVRGRGEVEPKRLRFINVAEGDGPCTFHPSVDARGYLCFLLFLRIETHQPAYRQEQGLRAIIEHSAPMSCPIGQVSRIPPCNLRYPAGPSDQR
jgi:hypothetical protein